MQEHSPPSAGWTRTQATRTWRWVWWTAASFPVAVLSHELAHYIAYGAFGFRNPKLHYGSSSFAGSEAFWQQMQAGNVDVATLIAPLWQIGVASAAGLVATYVTVTACIMVARRRPHPFIVGLGLIAALRFLGSAFILLRWMLGRRGVAAVLTGIAVGGAAYIGVLGPWLLP